MARDVHLERVSLRALIEGAPVSLSLVAQATGRSFAALSALARREGWSVPSDAPGEPRGERLEKLADYLIGKLEGIRKADNAAETLGKADVDTITALTRAVEKIGELTRSQEGAKQRQLGRDARIADVLKRIDQRIIELARGYAERLVAPKPR